jgi:hypothetical protein
VLAAPPVFAPPLLLPLAPPVFVPPPLAPPLFPPPLLVAPAPPVAVPLPPLLTRAPPTPPSLAPPLLLEPQATTVAPHKHATKNELFVISRWIAPVTPVRRDALLNMDVKEATTALQCRKLPASERAAVSGSERAPRSLSTHCDQFWRTARPRKRSSAKAPT